MRHICTATRRFITRWLDGQSAECECAHSHLAHAHFQTIFSTATPTPEPVQACFHVVKCLRTVPAQRPLHALTTLLYRRDTSSFKGKHPDCSIWRSCRYRCSSRTHSGRRTIGKGWKCCTRSLSRCVVLFMTALVWTVLMSLFRALRRMQR